MLYDVFYWNRQMRYRRAGFDREVTVGHRFKAPRGDVAECVNIDWDRHRFWVDERGDCWDRPPWEEGAKKYPE